jgi:hypothetical protein
MSADHDRVLRIIQARCADALTPDELAAFSNQPADTLPVDAAAQIVEVIDLMEQRLSALIARHSLPPPETMAELFKQVMVDLDIDAKTMVVSELTGLVELERATHEPIQ